MAELVKEREMVECIEYSKEYHWKDDVNAGFSFTCDEKGNITKEYPATTFETIKENLENGNLIYDGIKSREFTYFIPAIYKCHCGRNVEIEGDTRCSCGQWFNGFGQELVDDWFKNPSCYDEEVGDLF